MKRKAALVLLIGAVALCLMGCGEDEQAKNAGKGGTMTSQAPGGEKGVQPVPEGQGGTARTGDATGTGRIGEAAGGAAGAGAEVLAQQKNEYVQGAEKILNNIEQKLTAWQQQAGTQAQQDQKIQDLSKQTQQQITDARAAVEKMRTATGTQLKDAKVAADQAIQGAEQSFKNLQSYASQSQVTQAQ